MKQQIADIKLKLAALDERERWLVLLAGALLIFFIFNTLFLTPVTQAQKQLNLTVVGYQEQLAGLNQQINLLAEIPADQQAKIYQDQLAVLTKEIAEQQVQMAAIGDHLVSPNQMPNVLKDLMQSHQAIRMVSMETLKPEKYIESAVPANGKQNDLSLYKHAFSIVISGSYMDLMQYAEALQKLPNAVLWESASLRTINYPFNELTLNLYTLSVDEKWLSI